MQFNTLKFDVENHLAHVVLNRPKNGNAISIELVEELYELSLHCQYNEEIRAILIRAEGKYFSVGGEMDSFRENANRLPQHLRKMSFVLHGAINNFATTQKPIVTAINGIAAGAGFSLAIMGDIAIAANSAKFTLAYTKAGLSPDGGATYFLPRLVGARKAKELLLLNPVLTSQEAIELGLINETVEDSKLEERALTVATALAKGPTQAYAAVKSLISTSYSSTLSEQLELESEWIATMGATKDCQTGIEAFFEKKQGIFTGK